MVTLYFCGTFLSLTDDFELELCPLALSLQRGLARVVAAVPGSDAAEDQLDALTVGADLHVDPADMVNFGITKEIQMILSRLPNQIFAVRGNLCSLV